MSFTKEDWKFCNQEKYKGKEKKKTEWKKEKERERQRRALKKQRNEVWNFNFSLKSF